MAHVILVNGVQRYAKLQTPVIDAVAQDPHTMTADFISLDASFRPQRFQEITWTQDAVLKYGGIIYSAVESKLGDPTWTGIVTKIQASDFNSYAQRRVVFTDFPAQTLKARLTTIVSTYLSVYGVTLHASQVTGPTIAARKYKGTRLVDVLNETIALASTPNGADDYLWRIDYSKVLRAIVLGSEAAPFNLTDGDGNVIVDLTVENAATDSYANRIYATGGVVQEDVRTEHFPGALTFTPTWQVLNTYGYLTVDGVGEGISPVPLAAVWLFDPATNTFTDQGGTPPFDYVQSYRTFPASGAADIALIFKGQSYPLGSATDAGGLASYGPWEDVISPPNVGDATATLDDLAAAELSKRKDLPRTLVYQTLGLGLAVGQTQTVTNSKRNISGLSCSIMQLETRQDGKDLITHTVTLVESTKVRKDYHELLDRWLGQPIGTDPGVATVPSTASAVGPAPPNRSIQFNLEGAFGGDRRALLDPFRVGDTYGPFSDQATMAVGVESGTAIVQAWFNETAGKALAAWVEVDDLGRLRINGSGPNVVIGAEAGDFTIESAGSTIINAGTALTEYVQIPQLTAINGYLPAFRRINSNHTLDQDVSGGGTFHTGIWHDSASNHTLTLPDLSLDPETHIGGLYCRVVLIKNGGAGGTLTISPTSATIEGAATLVLQPNDGLMIFGKPNSAPLTGAADWKTIGGFGSSSSTGSGSGDVTGPSLSVDGEITLFDGTTGKLIKRATGTGVVHATSGVFSVANVNLASEVTGDLPYANLTPSTSASRLLGRGSASAGDWQEIDLSSDLAIVSTTLGLASGVVAVKRATIDLNNAQIKALPGTPFTIVAAPASGFRIKVLGATLFLKIPVTAYTGMDATYSALVLCHDTAATGMWIAQGPVNDSGITRNATQLTTFLGSVAEAVLDLTPGYWNALDDAAGAEYVTPGEGYGALANVDAKALVLSIDNNGNTADLTGGAAGNSLRVIVHYTIEQMT